MLLATFWLWFVVEVPEVATSVFGNAEFKLIVTCNLNSIFSSISILKSCKPKLCCSQNDKQTSVFFVICWIGH